MKKFFSIFLSFLLLMIFIPVVSAETAEHADLTVDFTPAENQYGQAILEMNITVHNGEDGQSIHSLEFRYENNLIAALDSLSAQSTSFARSNSLGMSLMSMTSDIEVEVSYEDFNGETVYQTMVVSYEEAEPKLTLKRTASATSAASGEKIRLTYIVKNEGNVPILDIQLYDDMEQIGLIDTIDELDAGEMRQYSVDVKMTADVKSQPHVSYRTSNTTQSTVLMLEAMDLVVYQPKLSVTLKSDVSAVEAGDSVTLVCNVVNEGNVAFTNVTISDSILGNLIEGTKIEVGKAYSWNKVIRPVDSQNYMVTVKAVDENGQVYTATSNIVSIKVSSPEQTDTAGILTATVTANTNVLDQPGEVIFNLLLRNNGDTDLSNVTVSDQSNNVLERMNSLQPGDRLVQISVDVTQSGEYFFVVDGTTGTGEKVQSITDPVQLSIGVVSVDPESSETMVPTQTPTPLTISSTEEQGGMAPWLMMLLIFVVFLIIACVVVLVILQVRSNRIVNEEEEAEEEFISEQRSSDREKRPEKDPYDFREEISRAASEYSRPEVERQEARSSAFSSPRKIEDLEDEDETPTVYKPRKKTEPTARRDK